MTLLTATEADVRRFMRYVVVLPNGCWFWIGARSAGGGNRLPYGSFSLVINGHKRIVRAHRFSSEVLGKQPCPPGHDRDHLCEFSLCVNPECIEVVLKKVNGERKTERRRGRETSGMERALEMYRREAH